MRNVQWLLILKFLVSMIPLIDESMFPNRFVLAILPTKAQIFARTGQRAVSPSGAFTGENSAIFGRTPTMSASDFLKDAEAYVEPEASNDE